MNDLREQEGPEQANSDEEQPDDRQDEWIVEWVFLDAERPGDSAEEIPCRSGDRAGSADDGIRGPLDASATASVTALRVIVGSGR